MISKKTNKTVRTGQGKRINLIGSSDVKEKHLDREPPPSYFGRYDKNHKPNHKEELVLQCAKLARPLFLHQFICGFR